MAAGLGVRADRSISARLCKAALYGHLVQRTAATSGSTRAAPKCSNQTVVSGGLDGAVRLWDSTRPGSADYEIGRHNAVLALAVASDDRVVFGGLDGAVRLWDPDVSRPFRPSRSHVQSRTGSFGDHWRRTDTRCNWQSDQILPTERQLDPAQRD